MRPTVPSSRGARRRLVWLAAAGALVLLLLLAWRLSGPSAPDAPTPAPILSDGDQAPAPARPAGPPWHHGAANARFTLVLYADLECPHCKTYFPEVLAWIEQHPDTRLQWHHLPLPAHEPAASRLASLAECAGETGGPAAFWQAVTWIYQHTRGDGQGLPEGLGYPGLTPATQQCLDSDRPDTLIRAQSASAAQEGIKVTPTLRLLDRQSSKTLLLHGPVEGDALLSAIDLLAAGGITETASKEMPAESLGDMPR